MSIHETVQESYSQLSPSDRKALLKFVGCKEPLDTTEIDSMSDPVVGKLILAHRNGTAGFSIQEYHKGKDAYLGEPGIHVQMARKVEYMIYNILHPNLHE